MSKVRTELQSWEELYAEEIAQFEAMDVIDDVTEDFGIIYEPYEELHCGDKGHDRALHRWDLDPASADDWDDRVRPFAQRWRHFGH